MAFTRIGALTCVLGLALLTTCKPDRAAFEARTFFCDGNSNQPRCGTGGDGTPLTCFAGKQLGAGVDFCVEPCSDDVPTSEAGEAICLKRAKLKTCRPSHRTADDPDGCGKDLGCLRTDLTKDQGVCMAMQVCTVDTDCKDSRLSTCGSTVLKALFPKAPYDASNLHCVATGCKALRTGCPVGEACLPDAVPASTPVPDICVPNCDSELNCPPNYTCWRKVSGPNSPAVCVPALPGFRCTTALDCWAGECVDTAEGFNLCALPCVTDSDCVPFSASSRRQYCATGKSGKRHCLGISPFGGTFCPDDSFCPVGQKCFFTSPYWPGPTRGECRLPCEEASGCPARGGLAHACFVRGSDRSCYPGVLGVTCQRSEDCLAGRTCELLPPTDPPGNSGSDATAPPEGRRVCTQPCATDADCLDGWNNQEGYCAAGWCRMAHQVGVACTRDQHCGANRCQNAGPGTPGTCTDLP